MTDRWGAAIAQWIRLQLPSCCSEFKSQAHHICFFQFILFKLYICHLNWNMKRTKQNKKRPGLAHFKKDRLVCQCLISCSLTYPSYLRCFITPTPTYKLLWINSVIYEILWKFSITNDAHDPFTLSLSLSLWLTHSTHFVSRFFSLCLSVVSLSLGRSHLHAGGTIRLGGAGRFLTYKKAGEKPMSRH